MPPDGRHKTRSRFAGNALVFALLACVSYEAMGVEFDASLRQFVDEAVAANPRVLAAAARLTAGDAMQAAARRSYDNPELSFEAENAEADVRAVGISKTLDLGGTRRARVSVAEAERLALSVDYQEVRRGVALDVLQGLAAYRALEERSGLTESQVELMSQFADFAERRFDAGDLSLVELDMAILASVDAQMSKATVAAELAEARERILAMVTPAQPESTWPRLDAPLPELAPSQVEMHAVLQLPEVKSRAGLDGGSRSRGGVAATGKTAESDGWPCGGQGRQRQFDCNERYHSHPGPEPGPARSVRGCGKACGGATPG